MKKAVVTFHTKDKKHPILHCELVSTLMEKQQGLMYREKIGNDQGMLFSFSFPGPHMVHMMNVKFPLDIIFISNKKRIKKIVQAEIRTLKRIPSLYCGTGKYVIECNQGFCHKNSIKSGDTVEIITQV